MAFDGPVSQNTRQNANQNTRQNDSPVLKVKDDVEERAHPLHAYHTIEEIYAALKDPQEHLLSVPVTQPVLLDQDDFRRLGIDSLVTRQGLENNALARTYKPTLLFCHDCYDLYGHVLHYEEKESGKGGSASAYVIEIVRMLPH